MLGRAYLKVDGKCKMTDRKQLRPTDAGGMRVYMHINTCIRKRNWQRYEKQVKIKQLNEAGLFVRESETNDKRWETRRRYKRDSGSRRIRKNVKNKEIVQEEKNNLE